MLLIRESSLGQPCGPGCLSSGKYGDALTKNEPYKCHEYTYGNTFLNKKSKWETSIKCKEAAKNIRAKM
eukprot:4989000-Pleurochrysis_carterae.AAC.1